MDSIDQACATSCPDQLRSTYVICDFHIFPCCLANCVWYAVWSHKPCFKRAKDSSKLNLWANVQSNRTLWWSFHSSVSRSSVKQILSAVRLVSYPCRNRTKKSDRPPLVWKGSVCNVRSVARRATFSFFWARLQLPCMVPGHWCLLPACVVWYLFQSCLLALKFDSGQIRVRKSKPTRWFMGVELVLPSCERAFWSSPCSKCVFEMRWQSFHFVQCFAQEQCPGCLPLLPVTSFEQV